MSEISDLVARLLAAGAAADVAAVVIVEAFNLGVRSSAEFRRKSVESPTDAAAERRRNADKLRKRLKAAERNSAAENLRNSAESAEKRCDLSSSLLPFSLSKEKGNREVKKESKSEIEAPAKSKSVSRGTRLAGDAVLSEHGRKFARTFATDTQIDQAWTEFVDFWIGVPGQRGAKANWEATWRNRVRNIFAKNGASGGHRGSRPLQDDSKSISRAAGQLAQAAERGEFTFGPRPSLLPDTNENVVQLLSKG